MIKRINNQNSESKIESVSGVIQSINEKGIKVNDRWFNFSKFLIDKPNLAVNDTVEFLASGNFITKFLSAKRSLSGNVSKNNQNTQQDETDNFLLDSLRSAVKIASIIESEVSIKFSTQDIIKLALTLFIQKTNL